MGERVMLASAMLAIVFGGVGDLPILTAQVANGEEASEAVFPMQEVEILDQASNRTLFQSLTRGARSETQEEPHEAVKAYPKLKSKKPIYGLVRLAVEPLKKDSGTACYFVIDESGDTPEKETAKEEPTEEKAKEKSSILDTLSAALGMKKEEPPAPPKLPELDNTYDRLYFDLNGDLDLTNDPVVIPMKETPEGLVQRYSSIRQCVIFDEISVTMNLGEELGDRPIRLIPRVAVQEYEGKQYKGVQFISAVARQGDIQLGDQTYQATLAQRYLIPGRYDTPFTGLLLRSGGKPINEHWWGADQLSAMRLLNDVYYTTSATPLGDKLTVKPYKGPMGLFKLDPGDRDIDKMTIQGSLQTKDTVLGLGKSTLFGQATLPVQECQLPAGDYLPNYVTIQYGKLRLGISNNYHADGQPRGADHSKAVYGIRIREDKPFVWDFSTPPTVMFASPAKNQTFKPGDEIEVNGVLIDPKLNIMIRRLSASTSLDPTVTITNASGKQIAEGPMPFG